MLRMVALGTVRTQGGFAEKIPAGSDAVVRALPSFVRAERKGAGPALYVKARVADAGPGTAGRDGDGGGSDLRGALSRLGVEVRGQVGPILSLEAPAAALESLARLPQIVWLKAARSYRTQNDVSTSSAFVGSRDANTTFGTRGAGAVVAVIDTGIDWTNPDFRNPDGTSRILAIWDQTLTDPLHPPPAGFSFGALYTKATLDAALAGGTGLPTRDGYGHGSHVAGSAAGNGLLTGNGFAAGTFAGVAPEASLIVVRVFDDQANFCPGCDLTAAIQFVKESAEAAGAPWVGNMSLGDDLGAHDGSDPDELTVDAVVGPGRPGSGMAIAAGNSGGKAIHWDGVLTTGATATNTFTVPSYTPNAGADSDFVWLDHWYDGPDRATVSIVTPLGQTVSAAFGGSSGLVCTGSGAVFVDATNGPDPANGDNEVFVQIWDSSGCSPVVTPQPGSWTIRIHGDSIAAGGGAFDLWDEADLGVVQSVALATSSAAKLVSVPGTSRNALTAGAFVDKSQWINASQTVTHASVTNSVGAASSFSGIGPTRDGRIKPDLAAPGEYLGSTLAGTFLSLASSFKERDGQHGDLRGTSMATPHVAGVVALLLAINPALDGAELKAAITRGALADAFTGTVPNNHYGAGKLRAPEAASQGAAIVTDLTAEPAAAGFLWTASPFVDSYNVYRGVIPGISSTNYGTCFTTGLLSPEFGDTALPATGRAFFYLTTGVRLGVEGILGTDSTGAIRPNTTPCP
jgi:subtilisin family serine protease